jgi:hypothetical protein
MRIDPIILGHNQFIGVDHLSQDRARNRTDRFGDIQKILDILGTVAEKYPDKLLFGAWVECCDRESEGFI